MNHNLLVLMAISLLLVSCDKDSELQPIAPIAEISANQEAAIEYFQDIALGFEFGGASKVTRKWITNIRVFVEGDISGELSTELDVIIGEINDLISKSTTTISRVDTETDANFFVFLGPGRDYATINPNAADLVGGNWGLFFVNFNTHDELTRANMYVDTERPNMTKQRHLLREEFTQALGLAMDSPKYIDSIFQSDFSQGCTTTFSTYDKVLIQLLYDPVMEIGLSAGIGLETVLTSLIPKYLPN